MLGDLHSEVVAETHQSEEINVLPILLHDLRFDLVELGLLLVGSLPDIVGVILLEGMDMNGFLGYPLDKLGRRGGLFASLLEIGGLI